MRLKNEFEEQNFFHIPHQIDNENYHQERLDWSKRKYSGHLGNMIEEIFGYEPSEMIPNRYRLEIQAFRQSDYERLKYRVKEYLKARLMISDSYDGSKLSEIFDEFEKIGSEKAN